MPPEPINHPEFTALAIGETTGDAVVGELTRLIKSDAEVRAQAGDVHRMASRLRTELRAAPAVGLDPERLRYLAQATVEEARVRWPREETLSTPHKVRENVRRRSPGPTRAEVWMRVAAVAVGGLMLFLLFIPATRARPPAAAVESMTPAVRLPTGRATGAAVTGRPLAAGVPTVTPAPLVSLQATLPEGGQQDGVTALPPAPPLLGPRWVNNAGPVVPPLPPPPVGRKDATPSPERRLSVEPEYGAPQKSPARRE